MKYTYPCISAISCKFMPYQVTCSAVLCHASPHEDPIRTAVHCMSTLHYITSNHSTLLARSAEFCFHHTTSHQTITPNNINPHYITPFQKTPPWQTTTNYTTPNHTAAYHTTEPCAATGYALAARVIRTHSMTATSIH